MSFAWLGTFRQGQWRIFREFVLNERRDAQLRADFILAELQRIGDVILVYARDGEGDITEKRIGMIVYPNTTLGKLVAAYTAQGGNPLDISMFLTPNAVVRLDSGADVSGYPSDGVLYPLGGDYAFTGEQFSQGAPSLRTFDWRRLGGRRAIDDRDIGDAVDLSRRWISQAIKFKRNDLEARIIKLCDLREQLLQELDQIAWMMSDFAPISGAGYGAGTALDQRRTITQIITSIDKIWYHFEDGVADFNSPNNAALGAYPNLMSDLDGGWEDFTGV
jgi:hypothetical protein